MKKGIGSLTKLIGGHRGHKGLHRCGATLHGDLRPGPEGNHEIHEHHEESPSPYFVPFVFFVVAFRLFLSRP